MKILLGCSAVGLSQNMKESVNLKIHDGNYCNPKNREEKENEKKSKVK